MRKSIYALMAFVTVFSACNKENDSIDKVLENEETVGAIVKEQLTKSDYTISGDNAIFEWSTGDNFYRLVRVDNGDDTYGTYAHYTYNLQSGAGDTDATFQGSSVGSGYDDSGYALYPAYQSNGATFGYVSSSYLYFTFNEELTYNSSTPLKTIVPMMGVKNEGEYEFYPVMGVIAISAKHIPSTATSISISSTSAGMSGTSVLLTSNTTNTYYNAFTDLAFTTTGLRNNWFSTGTAKTFVFSGLDPDETYTFYFPVPVGSYSDLTVTLKESSETIGVVTKSSSTTVTRGVITNITNTIDFDLANYCNVAVGGTSENITAYIESKSATISYVKFAMAASESDALTAAASSAVQISATGSGNAETVSGSLSETGTYYLAYIAYNSSDGVVLQGTIPSYYLSSSDATDYTGTYTFTTLYAFSRNATSSWVDLTGSADATLVIETSDDPTKGCVMITSLDGFACNGTFTNTSILPAGTALNPANSPINFEGAQGAGSPQYGYFENSTLFRFLNSDPFFSLDGINYYLRHGAAQYSYINFEIAKDASNVTLTYGSGSGFAFVNESSLKNNSDYTSGEICLKFGKSVAVATKAL